MQPQFFPETLFLSKSKNSGSGIYPSSFADHSILELRRLEREMTQIHGELQQSIKPKKQKLVALALQRGISKQYFRN